MSFWEDFEQVVDSKAKNPFVKLKKQLRVEPPRKQRAIKRTNVRNDFDAHPFMRGVVFKTARRHKGRRFCLRKGCGKKLLKDQKWVCSTECKVVVVEALANVISDLIPGGDFYYERAMDGLVQHCQNILHGI